MFDSGESAMVIAKELHVHPYRVAGILKENGRVYGPDKQKTSREVEQFIIDKYLEGYGTMDICRKLNKNRAVIRKVLQRNGVRLRRKEETKILGRNLPTL